MNAYLDTHKWGICSYWHHAIPIETTGYARQVIYCITHIFGMCSCVKLVDMNMHVCKHAL